ncbi:leucine-rich repeat-containing protein 70-like [Branchiostoma floridae]|uniref:Leucine-rich repeat-containing protein 70-like n=1 Tax=Branchiostoma floridae TaxID=7739 RepID=A0A9J7LJR4_BRAFL|nr:leucine-rich repeat-containing protein 70-like [Branchiostoma floridae]
MCSCTTILTFCMALVSLTAALQACTSPDGPGVCSCSGTRVNCDNKNLDSIPDNIPSSTTYLTLRHNKIGAIENTKLQHLPNLTRLNIDNNEITIILSQIFVGLQNLRELYLHNNSISVVEPGSFQHLVELTVLYLHYNRLTSLPSDAFVNLNKLRTLSISHNQISTLNNHTFAGLYQLSYLGTSHNEIRSLDDGIFAGLNQLSYLDISFNFIAVIPSSVASLKSLRYFNMSYNEVATIQPNMFSSRFFETLDLSHNNITWVRDWTFSNITFDIGFTLKLKGNHIKQLGKYSFYNISSKYDHMAYNHADIDLSDTQLERIHEEAFTYTLRNVHFGSFKFQDNNLETIPSTLCDFSTYPYDFRFNLSNNHWSCDCRMREILNCPNLGDEIICRLPPVLNDIRLSDLTLSNLACSSPIIHNISPSLIGETLTVNCHATGSNRPAITWSWTPVQPNGLPIVRSHDEVSTTTLGYNSVESRLTINRRQISDQGHYTCHASNVVGDDRKTLSLFVIPAETDAVPSTTNIPSVCIPSHATETVPSMTGPSTLSIPLSATVTETVPSITEPSTLPIPISATETVPSTTEPSTLAIPSSATETVPSTTGPSTLSIPSYATEAVPLTTGTVAGLSPSTNAVAPGHEENVAHSSATLIVATVGSFIGGVILCIIVAMIVYIKRRANRSLANKSSPQDATVATAQRRRGVDNANLGFEDDDGEYEDVNLYELRANVYQNQTLQREGPGDQDDVGRDGRIYDQIPQQGLGTAADPGESENHLYQDLLEERDHIYTSLQREGQRSEPHRPVH